MTVGAVVPDIASWPPLDDEERALGRQLLDWAADAGGAGPRLCLVRGASGSGKSRLLAWFLAGSGGHPATTVHATVLAEGLTAESFAWAAGRQLGYGPLAPARLLDRMSEDERPVLLLVPDLHRAGAGPVDLPAAAPATLVAELLEPLLSLPHVRAVVEVGESGLLPADDAETIDVGGGTTARPHTDRQSFADLVATVPHTADGRPDWALASAPVLRHVLDAALSADDQGAAVRGLLSDPGFLVHGSVPALTAVLADERIPVPGQLRRVWRRAAPGLTAQDDDSTGRAAVLHTAAMDTDAPLTEFLRPLAQRHWWSAVWARPDLPVTALALLPGTGRGLLAADVTGRFRTYDVDTGARTGVHPASGAGFVRPGSVAPRDARSALLLDDRADALLPWVPEDDPTAAIVLGHIAEYHGSQSLAEHDARVTALGNGPESPYAVVGDGSGALHLWSLTEYQDTPRSLPAHEGPVTAVACLPLTDKGLTLVFSAGLDGAVRLWETSAEPMPEPVERRGSRPTALAAADTPVGPVLAVAWSDGELHLWHVFSGRVRVLPLLHPCTALALTPEGLLVAGDPEGLYAVQLRLDVLPRM
ncbi:AAA family ATPase [Streptomyces sp. NPDC048420]|uniref:AAA family ATPase n=1 Tax=Streptomyces sp. NPDC048420 TaxID=3155755 RepID=UPI0034292CFF